MGQYRVADRVDRIYPLGMHVRGKEAYVSVAAKGAVCRLLLYRSGEEEPLQALVFPEQFCMGEVFRMTVLGDDFSGLEYCFEIDGMKITDPYGKSFAGREIWGDIEQAGQVLRCLILGEEFDWEEDTLPEIPYEACIIYRAHVRGFTKHSSSKVRNKGTFKAFQEKIPYLAELGITTLELLPVNEFEEVMLPDIPSNPVRQNLVEKSLYTVEKPSGKLNYWGYAAGQLLAPKASYASGKEKKPVDELKSLVKALHKEGMELILELYFTGSENGAYVIDVLRFWVEEYHVDGIHLVGFPPLSLIGSDPYLSRTKLWATSWEGTAPGTYKHLGEYNDGFLVDMRRVLKGDEDELNHLIFRSKRNPKQWGAINYFAGTNGFSMMDMVSYDTKHNEDNGENNQDGSSYNYSWNCGIEGPTRKKKIVDLRKKQLRNAMLLLFLSQGTPLLLAGDEFGNTKNGNNNAYCQDNETSWINWNLLKTNHDIFEFVKAAVRFRKAHPVFHMNEEPQVMDYLACGQPDVSYHGVKAWFPEFENFRRQLGIMYCGAYGKHEDHAEDNSFFIALNMHWEPHEFDLPNLPRGQRWHMSFNTDAGEVNGMYEPGKEPEVGSKQFLVPARSIVVLIGIVEEAEPFPKSPKHLRPGKSHTISSPIEDSKVDSPTSPR